MAGAFTSSLKKGFVSNSAIVIVMIFVVNCSNPTIAVSADLDVSGPRTYVDASENVHRMEKAADFIKTNSDGFSYSRAYLQEMAHNFLDILGETHLNEDLYHHDGGDAVTEDKNSGEFSILKVLEKVGEKETVSSPCINDTGRLIVNMLSGKPWALQFLDATGKPGPSITQGWLTFVGNYDQCRALVAPGPSNTTRDGFKGNYCVLSLALKGSPVIPQLGACLPSTCSPTEITLLLREIAQAASMSPNVIGATQCLTAETKVTTATIFAIIILTVVVCMAVIGTVYDVLFVQRDLLFASKQLEINEAVSESNGSGPNNGATLGEKDPLLPTKVAKVVPPGQSVGTQILLAFSLYTNGKKVLNTSQASGSLSSIHGIRFISMTWVVLGHCYLFGSNYAINKVALQDFTRRWTFDAIANAFVSVDTFFTLSGLLTAYLTIKELKRRGLGINWPMFYFHRFWRLTPPYMFAIVIVLGLQQYLGQGPFWGNEQPSDKAACEDNWWTNLLYVNNLVHPIKMCFAHSWYLANDMQFFVISPLMLIPFYFHWVGGVASCAGVILVSWITTGVLSSQQGWGVGLTAMRLNHWFDHYYVTPWCRIGPYAVGIMAGYILYVTKGKPFRMQRWLVAVGWVVATVSAFAVLYGVDGDISGEHPSSQSVAALYNTVGRTVWSACVCWVIIACSAGYGGPVNALLSWSPFVVLGRLTYTTYLFHLCFINVFFGNLGTPFFLNDTTMPILYLGLLLFSYMAAFVLMLLLESPMIGLEKAILRKDRKE